MTKTNVQPIPSNSQHHDTPNNKTHVIKFRVTAEEKASLELTCKLLNLSLSTFIRRAIHNVKIEKTVIVAGGGEKTLTAVSTLLAQCSKVGGQVCKFVKEFGPDLLGVRTAGIEVPCKLVEVGAHLATLSKQSGNSGQGFFSAAGNDDCFLDLDVVDGTADKSGEGEIEYKYKQSLLLRSFINVLPLLPPTLLEPP